MLLSIDVKLFCYYIRANKKGRKLAPSQAGKVKEKKSGDKLEKLRDNAGTKISMAAGDSLKVETSGETIGEENDKYVYI